MKQAPEHKKPCADKNKYSGCVPALPEVTIILFIFYYVYTFRAFFIFAVCLTYVV